MDGRLESEIELSRRFFQHLSNTYRADASGYLVELLDAAGIDCVPNGPVGEPAVLTPPENTVSWAGLVLLSPVFQALISPDSTVHAA